MYTCFLHNNHHTRYLYSNNERLSFVEGEAWVENGGTKKLSNFIVD